jgi:hypothetical protein
MEKEVHNSNSSKGSTKNRVDYHERYPHSKHNHEKNDTTYDTSFDELLYIPTLWDIKAIQFFCFDSILKRHLYEISVCGTSTTESLSEGMRNGPIDTSDHAFSVSFG